jgi:hypothetical protein
VTEEELTRRGFISGAASIGAGVVLPQDRRRYESKQFVIQKAGNAFRARESFAEFRRTIRPGMKWNWMTAAITEELQKFYNAFAKGKRPKLALELPPQHGKSWAAEDFIAWVAGKRPDWKTIFAS